MNNTVLYMVKTFDYPLLNSCWVEDVAAILIKYEVADRIVLRFELDLVYNRYCEATALPNTWVNLYALGRVDFVDYCIAHRDEIVAYAVI